MLAEIGSKDAIPAAMKKVKEKQDNTRLMGFAPRLKNYDPRAQVRWKSP